MKRLIAISLLVWTALYGQFALTGGTKTVTTAGTAVTLAASSTLVTSLTVQAKAANTGIICIGGSNVLAASKNGLCLTAGLAAPFYAVQGQRWDLSTIWIDSSVNGEGVSFNYAQ